VVQFETAPLPGSAWQATPKTRGPQRANQSLELLTPALPKHQRARDPLTISGVFCNVGLKDLRRAGRVFAQAPVATTDFRHIQAFEARPRAGGDGSWGSGGVRLHGTNC
jgi:hypothetical protein